jgi:ketosteroid isomerase-like protein
MNGEENAIWHAVLEANHAWTSGNPRGVEPLFHRNVVCVTPGLAKRIVGRQAMVESFVDYCARARTHSFEEKDPAIHIFGDTTVVNYRFAIRFETDGRVIDEEGQEILVFVRENGSWQVIWRTQIFLPSPNP